MKTQNKKGSRVTNGASKGMSTHWLSGRLVGLAIKQQNFFVSIFHKIQQKKKAKTFSTFSLLHMFFSLKWKLGFPKSICRLSSVVIGRSSLAPFVVVDATNSLVFHQKLHNFSPRPHNPQFEAILPKINL